MDAGAGPEGADSAPLPAVFLDDEGERAGEPAEPADSTSAQPTSAPAQALPASAPVAAPPPIEAAEAAVLLLASDDPAILRERVLKYQKVTAKLKETVAAREAELRARSAELAALQPFAEQMAASLLGTDEGGVVAAAKVAVPTRRGVAPAAPAPADAAAAAEGGAHEPAPKAAVPWCLLSNVAGDRHEWHPVDVVLARYASLAPALQVRSWWLWSEVPPGGRLSRRRPPLPSLVDRRWSRTWPRKRRRRCGRGSRVSGEAEEAGGGGGSCSADLLILPSLRPSAAAQDELRRFRVRADALARQKDRELADAKDIIIQARA